MSNISFKQLDNNYHYEISVSKLNSKYKFEQVVSLKYKGEKTLFKILRVDDTTNKIYAKRFMPCVYVWTTESYKKDNIYKVGIVNWQSVETRLKQTDTTGVLQHIELVEVFPLSVVSPAITLQIESEIHYRIGKVRKDREAVKGDYKKEIKPTIQKVIKEFSASPTKSDVLPTPRYYQYDAAQLAAKHFSKNDRGWVQWFCGTGKSYGGFWMWESIMNRIGVKSNLVVILVPSKQLTKQTHDDWVEVAEANGYGIRSQMVASTRSAGDLTSGKLVRWLENSTTDDINLIVSTYQSAHKVIEAVKISGVKPDLLICDEVHRLTGEQSKSWSKVLNNKTFPCRKRLAMTASPIEYNTLGFIGTNNEQLFGKRFHQYGFLDAQFDGYIAPLEIVGIQLPENEIQSIKDAIQINKKIIQKNLIVDDIDFSDIEDEVNIDEGSAIFYIQLHNTLMMLKNKQITHPIIYANSVTRIRMFMACLKALAVNYGVKIDYMNIFTSQDEIELRMKELNGKFAKAKIGVVGNVYCLQEGISINEVDSIVMIDPRSSGAAIIQIIGRPVRLNKSKPNKKAKILLPIICHQKNGKIVLDKSHFDTTRDWMLSIAAADSDFENIIFNDLSCINTKTRQGIEVKEVVKPKGKKPSVSGVNRTIDKNPIQLDKIDFSDYKEFAKLKKIVSTQKAVKIAHSTESGKNKYYHNQARTFVIGLQNKVEDAIQNYDVRKFNKYTSLIIDKDELVSQFSGSYDITPQYAGKILKEAKIDNLIKKISKLDKINVNNIVNVI